MLDSKDAERKAAKKHMARKPAAAPQTSKVLGVSMKRPASCVKGILLPKGWTTKQPYLDKGRADMFYEAPDGTSYRSKVEVAKALGR